MTTAVFVDFSVKGKPREIARDARDPLEHPEVLESVADGYSRSGRLVRLFADGLYITPWRKRKSDPLYESRHGVATADFA